MFLFIAKKKTKDLHIWKHKNQNQITEEGAKVLSLYKTFHEVEALNKRPQPEYREPCFEHVRSANRGSIYGQEIWASMVFYDQWMASLSGKTATDMNNATHNRRFLLLMLLLFLNEHFLTLGLGLPVHKIYKGKQAVPGKDINGHIFFWPRI